VQGDGLPKQYKITVNDEFYDMLDDTLSYYEGIWAESSITNFHSKIWQKVQNLATFPNGYRRWRDTKFRYCLVWDYLIFYKVDDAAGRVQVFWLMHAARDLESLLKEKEK